MKLSNWLHGLWKGTASVIVGIATTGALHLIFPHCPLDVCGAGGLVANFTVWSGLAGVGVTQAPPQGAKS